MTLQLDPRLRAIAANSNEQMEVMNKALNMELMQGACAFAYLGI